MSCHKIFITGGNGNLGRLVANQFLHQGHSVLKFDLPGSNTQPPTEGEQIMEGDIRDQGLIERMLKDYQPDRILHRASRVS